MSIHKVIKRSKQKFIKATEVSLLSRSSGTLITQQSKAHFICGATEGK